MAVRTTVKSIQDIMRQDSGVDGDAQRTASKLLRSLNSAESAKAAGLYGFHLLSQGDDTSKIVFSFTLFERVEGANLLRIQTDNLDQPFDLNEGARLDLGSTAKLRTLISYLEQIAGLHGRWSGLDAQQLAALEIGNRDPIAIWARDHLAHSQRSHRRNRGGAWAGGGRSGGDCRSDRRRDQLQ